MSTEIETTLLGQDVSFGISESYLASWLVVMRVVGGWWMLHAGLDKIWAWPFDASWFVGGNAAGTTVGPFVTLFSEGALLDLVNVAIPLGQTAIGLGLILGALTRTAAFFGALLLLFFFFINGETGGWSHGVVTAELLGIVVYGTIVSLGGGRIFGIDAYLAETEFVKDRPRLRMLLG